MHFAGKFVHLAKLAGEKIKFHMFGVVVPSALAVVAGASAPLDRPRYNQFMLTRTWSSL